MAHPNSIASDVDTLDLPRILCLHGGGTNATIFRAQCRVLLRFLKPMFRLCFADAPFPSEPGPDVVSVYRGFGPFRAWLRQPPQDDPEMECATLAGAITASLQRTMAEDDRRGATGKFVGLLGFSQGAKVCASLLYRQQQHQLQAADFRFAILLAGRGPLVSLIPDDARPGKQPLLSLPTLHVHGLADPGLELHRQLLYESCDLGSARLIEWDGIHRVPIKTKDVAAVVEAILAMAKDTGIFIDRKR